MMTFDLAGGGNGDPSVVATALHPSTYMPTKIVHSPVSTIADGVRATSRLVWQLPPDRVDGQYFNVERPARAHSRRMTAMPGPGCGACPRSSRGPANTRPINARSRSQDALGVAAAFTSSSDTCTNQSKPSASCAPAISFTQPTNPGPRSADVTPCRGRPAARRERVIGWIGRSDEPFRLRTHTSGRAAVLHHAVRGDRLGDEAPVLAEVVLLRGGSSDAAPGSTLASRSARPANWISSARSPRKPRSAQVRLGRRAQALTGGGVGHFHEQLGKHLIDAIPEQRRVHPQRRLHVGAAALHEEPSQRRGCRSAGVAHRRHRRQGRQGTSKGTARDHPPQPCRSTSPTPRHRHDQPYRVSRSATTGACTAPLKRPSSPP